MDHDQVAAKLVLERGYLNALGACMGTARNLRGTAADELLLKEAVNRTVARYPYRVLVVEIRHTEAMTHVINKRLPMELCRVVDAGEHCVGTRWLVRQWHFPVPYKLPDLCVFIGPEASVECWDYMADPNDEVDG